ncbi:class I SAM-dependent methyltransferase [Chitinophaga sp. S165]|uniref:class I SAM-dependent methyltransferase n=1 Tax=Chitinophaga sp. S165 TaxID=2135462 RepID=UPI000D713D08|nr:class I SAM-dependent methyltransferase [Chitinophaga sp. S165]PWV51531.1 S-adenosylmethionine-dependent methyltransferase [Chitinophaga sp. S165]
MKKYLSAAFTNFLLNFFKSHAFRSSFNHDIALARSLKSLSTTVDYVDNKMSHIPSVDHHLKVHDVAIQSISIPDGLILEFGVFSGKTINHIAEKLPGHQVYGFDSFEGLPEFWRDGYEKGHFAVTELPQVAANVTLVKGWFDQTLPDFKAKNDSALAYLHVDCDLYSSAKTIFDMLKDNIVAGTVIVFDEYFNYPGWMEGEFKAFHEFLAETGKEYKYLTYNVKHEQVAVVMTKG